jgi:hypothetical protein
LASVLSLRAARGPLRLQEAAGVWPLSPPPASVGRGLRTAVGPGRGLEEERPPSPGVGERRVVPGAVGSQAPPGRGGGGPGGTLEPGRGEGALELRLQVEVSEGAIGEGRSGRYYFGFNSTGLRPSTCSRNYSEIQPAPSLFSPLQTF